jgi:hypothetical protein
MFGDYQAAAIDRNQACPVLLAQTSKARFLLSLFGVWLGLRCIRVDQNRLNFSC